MDNYDWEQHEHKALPDRFPDTLSAIGLNAWRLGATALWQGNPAGLGNWPQLIGSQRATLPRMQCPRVFVSHRQSDVAQARRVAYLADQAGFDFWLDVIDLPASRTTQIKALETHLGRILTAFEFAVLQAAIIEMALVNCTHVIAVVTMNTAGSQWVPYEYGRVVDRSAGGAPATAWWDTSTIKLAELPEYLHLAPLHGKEADIRAWLVKEIPPTSACTARTSRWTGRPPKKLPTG